MKTLSEQLLELVESKIPSNAKVGSKYKTVKVDGETFRDLTLIDISNSGMTFQGKTGINQTFSPFEQEIKLS